MGVIYYNNISSSNYGLVVEHPPAYVAAEKEYTQEHVPGRNGDVYIWTGSYKNVTVSYEIAFGNFGRPFHYRASQVSDWLHSADTYVTLEDTYDPDVYRMALYKQSLSIENILFEAGRATIEFDCKPQRFLKSGLFPFVTNPTSIAAGKHSLYNPTNQTSRPKIRVAGTGKCTVKIGTYQVTINESGAFNITIDSEMYESYTGAVNKSKSIELLNYEFPKLVPGLNRITTTGTVTEIEVIPRWWKI